ncbi:hypothetical protein BY996DRAFT_6541238 [Phakopsora pachyrhizi]|nr:hypothetical protein BY996DRAFT_6541238 [Phakopsora pachyrhizi]
MRGLGDKLCKLLSFDEKLVVHPQTQGLLLGQIKITRCAGLKSILSLASNKELQFIVKAISPAPKPQQHTEVHSIKTKK